jgi:hypothetical protein
MKIRKYICALCCVVPLLAGTGCVSNRYLAPVTSFRDKTGQTIGVIGDFYSSRNSYELDTYLQTVATDGSLVLATVDSRGQPTPLGKPVFSPASIKARLDALDLIGVYAGKLYDLASTDAPTKFQEAATSLGGNLGSLDKTFQSLQGANDPTANKYIGPVSQLVGAIGKMFLEHKRDQLIKEAVNDGAPVVDKILSLVRDDMDKIFSLEVVTGSNERLATLTVAYNRDRERLSYEQRVARLKEIKAAAAEAASSVGAAPSALITSMMTAHKALIAAVTSDSKTKITNLTQFSVALDHWTTQIQSLSAQVRMLIH